MKIRHFYARLAAMDTPPQKIQKNNQFKSANLAPETTRNYKSKSLQWKSMTWLKIPIYKSKPGWVSSQNCPRYYTYLYNTCTSTAETIASSTTGQITYIWRAQRFISPTGASQRCISSTWADQSVGRLRVSEYWDGSRGFRCNTRHEKF